MSEKERCTFDPVTLLGLPMGMLHCPECGEMILAGVPHPPPEDEIDWTGAIDPRDLDAELPDLEQLPCPLPPYEE